MKHVTHTHISNKLWSISVGFFFFSRSSLQLHLNISIQLNCESMSVICFQHHTNKTQTTKREKERNKLVFRTNWHEIFSSKSKISSRVRAIFFCFLFFVLLLKFLRYFCCAHLFCFHFFFFWCQLLFRCLFLHWFTLCFMRLVYRQLMVISKCNHLLFIQ